MQELINARIHKIELRLIGGKSIFDGLQKF